MANHMKICFAVLLLATCAFAANPGNQVSFLLDVGQTTFRLYNIDGSSQLDAAIGGLGSFSRIGVTLIPEFVPPASQTTTSYAPCGVPCGQGGTAATTRVDRNEGQVYMFFEDRNTDGTVKSPRVFSSPVSAYDAKICNGPNTIPQVVSVDTTAPVQFPWELLGQDCYQKPFRLPLISGHGTSLRVVITLDETIYNTFGRNDGKISIGFNGGYYVSLANATSGLVYADEAGTRIKPNDPGSTAGIGTPNVYAAPAPLFGGAESIRTFIFNVPSGAIQSGDTFADIYPQFNGTEFATSGLRILHLFITSATDCTLTAVTKSGTTGTGTCSGHGFANGDTIFMRGADGMMDAVNGPRTLSGVSGTTFSFPTCGNDRAFGSDPVKCAALSPDGSYMPPVNRKPYQDYSTDQAYAYVTKSWVALTSFTQIAPSSFTAGSGDATKGACLWQYGNESCTPGEHNLINPGALGSPASALGYKTSANCKNCHDAQGNDLKYHGYSNWSIRVRSVFHGFTADQGDDIAAYIRGLTIAVPPTARPFNAPMQMGPGMECCTWSVASSLAFGPSALTSIVISNSPVTGTTVLHVTDSGTTQVSDPIYIYGAVGGAASINGYCTATAVTSTTITCITSGATTGTYTDTSLVANMAHHFMAGAGYGAVVNYPYSKMYATMLPSSNFTWTKWADNRKWAYPYQLGSISKSWWPQVWPGDVPNGNFLSSPAYTNFLSVYAATTYGDFNSWKNAEVTPVDPNCNVGGHSGYGMCIFRDYIAFWGVNIGDITPNTFGQANYGSAMLFSGGMNFHFRQSVANTQTIEQWSMAVSRGTLPMNVQRMTALFGAATVGQGYPPWGFGSDSFVFHVGPHFLKADPSSVLDKQASTYWALGSNWYLVAPGINCGNGLLVPSVPCSADYYQAFIDKVSSFRAAGYVQFLTVPIMMVQNGQQNANIYEAGGPPGTLDGQYLTIPPLNTSAFGGGAMPGYWLFTESEFQNVANQLVVMANEHMTNSPHNAAYWLQVFVNIQHDSDPSYTTGCEATTWVAGNPSICAILQTFLTHAALFSSDTTTVNAFAAWLTSLSWPRGAHDFSDDVAAATYGDTGDYGRTGDLTSAGNVTIHFDSSCPGPSTAIQYPKPPLVLRGSAADDIPDKVYPAAGGSCTVRGGTGTLLVTTVHPHADPPNVTWSCSKHNLFPNWPADIFNDTINLKYVCLNEVAP